MARPLRIEFAGAIYHVTSRGNRQERIFDNDDDRRLLLSVIDKAMDRLDAEVLAFCFMGNHYHLVLRTRRPNLSRLMRHINGNYTRAFNCRHGCSGHLLQGRFHAVLVDADAYLVQVCRYVDLNPVRAGLVDRAEDWRWSSYRAHVGLELGYPWLATLALHGHLLKRDVTTTDDQRLAARLYADAVAQGHGVDLWNCHLRSGSFLGDDDFVARVQARATRERLACVEINKDERSDPRSLEKWLSAKLPQQESFRLAYTAGGMTMSEIARQADVSVSTVSRMISAADAARRKT